MQKRLGTEPLLSPKNPFEAIARKLELSSESCVSFQNSFHSHSFL